MGLRRWVTDQGGGNIVFAAESQRATAEERLTAIFVAPFGRKPIRVQTGVVLQDSKGRIPVRSGRVRCRPGQLLLPDR